MVATFEQSYQSNNLTQTGRKRQYWQRDSTGIWKIQIMGSRAVAEQVVIAIDPAIVDKPQLTRERAVSELMKGLKIWSPRDTTVIGVSVGVGDGTRGVGAAQRTNRVGV